MASPDEIAIRQLMDDMTDAWNRGDARAFGARYRADGTFDDSAVTDPGVPTPQEPYLIPLMVPQFLTEAILISLTGGVVGIIVGVALPLSVQVFVDNIRIPISSASIVVAFSVSSLVGLIFGILPASRASRLNPTEALRYE